MTRSELTERIMKKAGDDPALASDRQYYSADEIATRLNSIQRVFVLTTLCLERTATFALRTDGDPFYHLMDTYADWILPLRVRITSGAKLKYGRLADLAGLDNAWAVQTGAPTRYALLGFDLMAIYKQPTSATNLDITFARSPAKMVSDSDVPEIPEEYHPILMDGAIPFLRSKEGAQEHSKTMPYWMRFIEGATKMAEYIRARNKELGYDYEPMELKRFDMSRMTMKLKAEKAVQSGG